MNERTNDELRIMAERPEAERTVDIFITMHKMYIHEHQFGHPKEEVEHLLSFYGMGNEGIYATNDHTGRMGYTSDTHHHPLQ